MDFRSTRRMVNRIDKNLGQGMPKVKKTIEKKNKVRHMADICLKVRYENRDGSGQENLETRQDETGTKS